MPEKESQLINNQNLPEKINISRVDLNLLIKENAYKLDRIEDEEGFSLKLVREMDLELMQDLMLKKDCFKNIFKTKNGSVYFLTGDVSSLRFKKEGEYFKRQPIINNIFFVDDSMRDNLLKILKSGDGVYLIDKEIEIKDFGVDKTPVDFGIIGYPEVVFEVYARNEKNILRF
ncbi:MAG: hypothetical protein V3574_00770 [Candidatus Moraniibacteriota bacterium]